MFLIAQIPFVDLRLLSERPEEKYVDCIFPNNFVRKMTRETYYRYLGKEKLRYSPIELPESERQFFDSSKMLLLNENIKVGGDSYHPRLVFSRLYADAQFFHFDLGIRETSKNNLSQRDLNKFLNQFTASPLFSIRKSNSPDRVWCNFAQLTEQLQQIYIYATDRKKKITGDPETAKAHSYKVVLGHPALFITYDKNEISAIQNAKCIKLDNGIEVWHELLPVGNVHINVWYIGKNDLAKHNPELRNLRIYLSKLHSYKESLRIVLEKLQKSNDFDREKIIYFFEYIIPYLHRDKYYGYSNEDFWKLVFAIDDTYNHVTWNGYKNRVNAYLYAVKNTVNINNGIIINGDVGDNVALVSNSENVNISLSQRTQNQN